MSLRCGQGKCLLSDHQILKCNPWLFFEIVKVTILSFSPNRESLRKSTELCREDEPGENHLDLEALRVDAVQTLKHVAHELHHPVTSQGFFLPLHFNQVNRSLQKSPVHKAFMLYLRHNHSCVDLDGDVSTKSLLGCLLFPIRVSRGTPMSNSAGNPTAST